MKKHISAAVIFAIILTLDIITKYLIVSNLGLHERVNLLGSFVQITLVYNRGGLWGILQGYQSMFLGLSILVLVLLILFYLYEKNKTMLFCNAMGLIVGGAIGNILDRISGKPGVVDFIWIGHDEIYRWPAFNVADSSIVVGACLLLIVFYYEEKRRRAEKERDQ
jgi:signal peptidase II